MSKLLSWLPSSPFVAALHFSKSGENRNSNLSRMAPKILSPASFHHALNGALLRNRVIAELANNHQLCQVLERRCLRCFGCMGGGGTVLRLFPARSLLHLRIQDLLFQEAAPALQLGMKRNPRPHQMAGFIPRKTKMRETTEQHRCFTFGHRLSLQNGAVRVVPAASEGLRLEPQRVQLLSIRPPAPMT